MEKYWVSRDGVWGTVHLNRDEKEVDFRPLSRVEIHVDTVEPNENEPDESVIQRLRNSVFLCLLPGRSVSCAPKRFKVSPEDVSYTMTVGRKSVEFCVNYVTVVVNSAELKAHAQYIIHAKFKSLRLRAE